MSSEEAVPALTKQQEAHAMDTTDINSSKKNPDSIDITASPDEPSGLSVSKSSMLNPGSSSMNSTSSEPTPEHSKMPESSAFGQHPAGQTTPAGDAAVGVSPATAESDPPSGGAPAASAARAGADGAGAGQQPPAGDDCYRYEGETCVYTDPSSGLEYVYSAEKEGWLRRDGAGNGQPLHAPTLENCYYEGEHYCFRDAAGQVYRLEPSSNSWERWPAAESGAAPAADCFRDESGAWCCRDDSGALCHWSAEASRWERAAAPAGRKRKLNRGSSDDSEHDSDEEEDGAARKRATAPGPAAEGGAAPHEEEANDGTGYEWDAEKGAWFPKIDEEFLALHRLNYGFDSEGRPIDAPPILDTAPPPPPAEPPAEKQLAGKQRKMNKKKPEWFQLDDSKNTKVYVSGLAESTTEAEFVELMSKCGLVMKDPLRGNAWKVKLYRDDYGVPKGDGICTYIKIESVNLALDILDGYEFKGKRLSVEKATFDMKGSFDPTKKPKKRTLKKKDREKLQKKQEKLFAWQPDKIRGERERHERVVIIKNLFSPDEFRSRPEMILEYQQDLRDECSKYGAVRKVVLHDRHKDGVVEVIFQEAVEADACVTKMSGRWFAGRRLEAATWDGKTKYRVEETEEERAERLAKWEQFISGEEAPSAGRSAAGPAPAPAPAAAARRLGCT
ncbi:HIV Tat-specific factor 1 homolog [Pollicipes pollicipes]|uniref:HIV Tat-specific factor 1 homolog n=1 Tax=Pollicipes pollicipes TaxID=41117 RepID=UPI001884A1F2|nr:HIV Tat-specific factor 1 homolog [Pollicipes pollicipes]